MPASLGPWWMEHGWARYGSQLQTQLYVNRRSEALNQAVLGALPALGDRNPSIEWVAPLESSAAGSAFIEPRDDAMLSALGLEELASALRSFWPTRGPVWDALATL